MQTNFPKELRVAAISIWQKDTETLTSLY